MDVVDVVAPALKGCVWGRWMVGVGGGGRGYDDAVTFVLLVEDIGVWSLVVDGGSGGGDGGWRGEGL